MGGAARLGPRQAATARETMTARQGSDPDGAGLVYNRAEVRHPSVLAANPGLHAKLLEILRDS